jgi:chromosome segregation ATPase
LAQAHLAQERPAAAENGGPLASRASLQADLANAQGQIGRQAARIRQLEAKLSQMLGDQAWRESGLGAPEDIDKLKRRITELEQHVVELTRQLEERGEELAAARATNREMITPVQRRPAQERPPGGRDVTGIHRQWTSAPEET